MANSRVGSHRLAEHALRLAHRRTWSVADWCDWEKLGEGSFRIVLLHKATKVVYKVERRHRSRDWEGTRAEWERYITGGYGNRGELRQARLLRRLEWEHCYIPQVSGYTIGGKLVVAMEWLPYPTLDDYDEDWDLDIKRSPFLPAFRELRMKARLSDLHGSNVVIMPSMILAPIDLGSRRLSNRAWNRLTEINMNPLDGASTYE